MQESAKMVSVEQTLPLSAALRPLFPHGGLRRGSTISVLSGSTTLLFTLLAEASAAERRISAGRRQLLDPSRAPGEV